MTCYQLSCDLDNHREILAKLDLLELSDQLVHREHLVFRERRVLLETKDQM